MITFRYFPAPATRKPGEPISEIRRVTPMRLYYGTCPPWYSRPQLLLEGMCQDRQALRTFALARIHPAPCPNGPHCKPSCLLCSGLNRLPLQSLISPLPAASSGMGCRACPNFTPESGADGWGCANIDVSAAWIDAVTGATNGRMPENVPQPIPTDATTCPGFPNSLLLKAVP